MPRTQTQVQIRHPRMPQYEADIRVSDGSDHTARDPFAHLAGFELRTGAAAVHTYMCASECRALAKALSAAAMRLELAMDGDVPADEPTSAPAPATSQTPAIGQAWPAQGGLYAGIARGAAGAPDQHLVLCVDAEPGKKLTWRAALEWARGLRLHGFTDWSAPSRNESALLYANLRGDIGGGWCWTAEEYDGSYAWYQGFYYGTQVNYHKSAEGRAVAVRRFDVQSFNTSTATADSDTAERADAVARLLQTGSM